MLGLLRAPWERNFLHVRSARFLLIETWKSKNPKAGQNFPRRKPGCSDFRAFVFLFWACLFAPCAAFSPLANLRLGGSEAHRLGGLEAWLVTRRLGGLWVTVSSLFGGAWCALGVPLGCSWVVLVLLGGLGVLYMAHRASWGFLGLVGLHRAYRAS